MSTTTETKGESQKELAYKRFVAEAENFFVKKFIDSPKIKETYSFCLDVMFGLENDPEVDYSRGIILYSPQYGQGKSFFFDVVYHRYKRILGKQPFVRTTAKDLVKVYVESGEEGLLAAISVVNLFIDDIGDEGENKNFQREKSKNTLNVIRWVLLKRYEMWVDKSWKTYGTTNISLQEMQHEYDGRVSDRLEQMVHFTQVSFLKSGTFRQQKSTRKLTRPEIDANLKRFQKQDVAPQETLDVVKYLNDLITEDDEYIKNMGWVSWGFIKKQLLEKGVIKESDFIFDDEDLKHAEFVLRYDTLETVKFYFKNADREVKLAEKQRRLEAITGKDITEMAATILAKRVFMNLRETQYKFE